MNDNERTKAGREDNFPNSKLYYWSHLPFLWGLITIFKTYKKGTIEEDSYDILQKHKTKPLGDKLEQSWQQETYAKRPSLSRVIFKVFRFRLAVLGILQACWQISISILQPLLTKKLLENYALEQTIETERRGYIYVSMILLLILFRIFGFHGLIVQHTITGIKVEAACASVVYRKVLSLNRNNIEKVSSGQIVNLLSNDVKKFERCFRFIHYLWIAPLELALSSFVIYYFFGYTALTGVATILIIFLLQVLLSKILLIYRLQIALQTDSRLGLMNEIVRGVQLIKMYTWEKPFANLVESVRRSELNITQKYTVWRLFLTSTSLYVGRVALFSFVVTNILLGRPLEAEYIFATGLFYESLRTTMTTYLPYGMKDMTEICSSCKRLEKFLSTNDLVSVTKKSNLILNKKQKLSNRHTFSYGLQNTDIDIGIRMCNVIVKWNSDLSNYSLCDISLDLKPKQLVAIVGSAGSGKSTLLQVMIKELKIEHGYISVNGIISYASQEPWIFSGSLKKNILFDQNFDYERYRKIIKICALEHDLSFLPHGDNTLVGERGVMLSGGQKARVNLARTIYKDADIYFLDDPLSAVDAYVSKQIFNQCILDHLKDKCVVLVTHQLQYLRKVDKIYYLEEGKIVANGSFAEVSHLQCFQKLSNEHKEKDDKVIDVCNVDHSSDTTRELNRK